MKRLILLLLVIVVVGAVVYLAPPATYSKPKRTSVAVAKQADAPVLKTLELVQLQIDEEKGTISVALNFRGAKQEGFVSDIVETYRWANSHYKPYKCGRDYEPAMCKIGTTLIVLVVPSEVPGVDGQKAPVYMISAAVGLDQMYAEKFLKAPPTTPAEVMAYHKQVMEQSQQTGGFIQEMTEPTVFTGLE